MQLHNQLFKQTSLPVLGSRNLSQRVYWSICAIKFPFPNFCFWRWLLTQLLPRQHHSPSTKCKSKWSKQRETAVFHIQKKEGREGEKRGKCLNSGIYLLKHRKTHTYRHHVGRNPSSQGCRALLPASICLKLHRSFLPLSRAHRSVLKIALNCQPKCISGLMKV